MSFEKFTNPPNRGRKTMLSQLEVGECYCAIGEVKKQPPNLTAGEFNRSE